MKRSSVFLTLLSILIFCFLTTWVPTTSTILFALDIPTLGTFEPPGPTAIRLDINSNGQTIDLQVRDEIHIYLEVNGSTGYWWYFEDESAIAGDFFQLIAEDTVQTGTAQPKPGASTTHIWKLKPLKPGSSTIRMKYYRIWKGSGSAIKQFEIRLNIN